LIELAQVRRGHLHRTHRSRLFRQLQGRHGYATAALLPHALQDGFHVETGLGPALLDGTLDLLLDMVLQQLQNADVMLGPVAGPMLPFQCLAEFAKHGGQLPTTEDLGVVQSCRPAVQPVQIMLGIKDLLVPTVATRMRCQYLATQHDVDPLHIGLDRHRLEGGRARHAVAVGFVANHLVLVDFGRRADTRIEGPLGQGQRLVTLACETLADALGLAGLDAFAVT
jgi:hypothetical protein